GIAVSGPDSLVGRPLADVERYYMEKALEQTKGNREEAAKTLGISERTLYRKIQERKKEAGEAPEGWQLVIWPLTVHDGIGEAVCEEEMHMTITLPDRLNAELERKAQSAGFTSVGDYVAWLVEADEEPTPEELGFRDRAELEAKLMESLNSGSPIN